ncbi:SpoIIE family protein phosphatase [Streptomyces californicus]|uniref:SpoIIE family protein phosphatase n=1 Tax=Streptomyces californicus TaxID=67351 RepID=A0ABD7DAY1_9ACTN|nr:SpoIIE family protein phosphatase [Streptomyces californicus]QRV38678.1 SpoIIE family protein phosphatase [Streptomyces californicus]QRV45588.1 SpoIIE family protein phosphatase [Streptomyces californicus]QRV52263.1 SpoIIE family protein phosphatase [Streptomyces californicus]
MEGTEKAGWAGVPDQWDEAVLATLFTQSGVGLVVLDPQLRLVRANAHFEGVATKEYIGRRFTDAFRLDDPEGSEELLKQVLAGRGPVRDHLVSGRLRTIPGDRQFQVSAYRLDAPGGDPDDPGGDPDAPGGDGPGAPGQGHHGADAPALGLVTTVVDVTDRERARARETALTAVRDTVGGSLDTAATCRALIDALVPGFADLAAVEVVDDVLRGVDPPVGPLPPDTPLRRAASGRCDTPGDKPQPQPDPDLAPDPREDRPRPAGVTRRLPLRTPFALTAADLRPRLVPLTPDTPWLDADAHAAHAVAESGAHSLIVVPLSLRGAVLGLVSLYRCGEAEPFDEDDVTLAMAAATRAALAIDNARRFEREHVIASTVQRRLLPQAAREQAAVETAHVLLPGRDSGCWYDTIALAGARTALVVGRVEGEGLQTAIVMGQLRTVIQALADLDLEPEEVLARLKDTADRLAEERDSLPPADVLQREPLSAGCLYGVYDPFARTCTVARAGHPAPIVVGPDGRAVPFDVPEGPGLFSDDSALFAPAVVTLDVGSLLAFCTADLLTGDRAAERIAETLSRPGRTLRQAGDDVVYALPADTRAGGAALLLARTGTVSDHKVATWDLSQERRAPATARALVRDRLQEWGLDEDTVEASQLIVSELVTNAVRYGTPPLRLRVLLDSTLTCEVHDGSPASPHLRHARTVDEGGRGLFIVSRLASHWGARHGPDGKVLWTEQELPSGESEGTTTAPPPPA